MPLEMRAWFDDTATDAFWAQVRRGEPDECWPWNGCVDGQGRGHLDVYVNGVRRRLCAHRVAYVLEHGDQPHRHLTCSCGRRSCCNPRHWGPKGGVVQAPVLRLVPTAGSGRHPWLDIVAAIDRAPRSREAERVGAAIRLAHRLPVDTRWDSVAQVVCQSRRSPAELNNAYLDQFVALGGRRIAAA